MAKYTQDNRMEIPDPRPVEMPIGYEHPEPLESMIARMVRLESERAGQQGLETFEEADDFDVDDDEGELVSPYQMSTMQEELPHESKRLDNGNKRPPAGPTKAKTTEGEPEAEPAPKAKKKAQKVVEETAEETE